MAPLFDLTEGSMCLLSDYCSRTPSCPLQTHMSGSRQDDRAGLWSLIPLTSDPQLPVPFWFGCEEVHSLLLRLYIYMYARLRQCGARVVTEEGRLSEKSTTEPSRSRSADRVRILSVAPCTRKWEPSAHRFRTFGWVFWNGAVSVVWGRTVLSSAVPPVFSVWKPFAAFSSCSALQIHQGLLEGKNSRFFFTTSSLSLLTHPFVNIVSRPVVIARAAHSVFQCNNYCCSRSRDITSTWTLVSLVAPLIKTRPAFLAFFSPSFFKWNVFSEARVEAMLAGAAVRETLTCSLVVEPFGI